MMTDVRYMENVQLLCRSFCLVVRARHVMVMLVGFSLDLSRQ
jgi:hypothetical protein